MSYYTSIYIKSKNYNIDNNEDIDWDELIEISSYSRNHDFFHFFCENGMDRGDINCLNEREFVNYLNNISATINDLKDFISEQKDMLANLQLCRTNDVETWTMTMKDYQEQINSAKYTVAQLENIRYILEHINYNFWDVVVVGG